MSVVSPARANSTLPVSDAAASSAMRLASSTGNDPSSNDGAPPGVR